MIWASNLAYALVPGDGLGPYWQASPVMRSTTNCSELGLPWCVAFAGCGQGFASRDRKSPEQEAGGRKKWMRVPIRGALVGRQEAGG